MLRTPLRESLRPRCAPARQCLRRSAHSSVAPPQPSPPPPPPPPPKYLSFATAYPFILLSVITSLAVNLGVQRTARETEGARHRAQISVLEDLVARLRSRGTTQATDHWLSRGTGALSEEEQEEIERELELVGLGRGRGKAAVSAEMSVKSDWETSWKEVFLGKKGKGYEQEDDQTDWEAGASNQAGKSYSARTQA